MLTSDRLKSGGRVVVTANVLQNTVKFVVRQRVYSKPQGALEMSRPVVTVSLNQYRRVAK